MEISARKLSVKNHHLRTHFLSEYRQSTHKRKPCGLMAEQYLKMLFFGAQPNLAGYRKISFDLPWVAIFLKVSLRSRLFEGARLSVRKGSSRTHLPKFLQLPHSEGKPLQNKAFSNATMVFQRYQLRYHTRMEVSCTWVDYPVHSVPNKGGTLWTFKH